ncbi:LysR substrate-binding domain-containing protein [Pseudomonas fluvialis]|uniref:LysR substrate-binding domain-containing protein n=1 Tax=Pseudomonas fluvialis TaxID=1793966 RepID=UPI00370C0118
MSSLPPLNALRAFEASARLGSFTRAAEELHVTQAAVSQQVKQLEQHLAARLFIREAKGLRLTEQGRSYLPALTQAFHTMRSSTAELFGERGRTQLNVQASNSFAEHFLAPRLHRFLAEYPRFRVRVSSSPWTVFDQPNNADVEICNGYGDWTNRQVERLTHEHWLLVCSPQTLARRGTPGSTRELLEWPLLSVLGYRESWSQWLAAQQVSLLAPPPCLEFDTTTLAMQAVRHADGVLLTRSFLVGDALRRGELVRPHAGTLETRGGHYLVSQVGDQRPKVLAFCDWLRRELRIHQAGLAG